MKNRDIYVFALVLTLGALTVFPSPATAQAAPPIAAARYHLIINPEPDTIYVSEMYVLAIDARAAPPMLHFPLPVGYRDLRVDENISSDVIIAEQDGFVDTRPITASMKQLLFAYSVATKKDSSYELPLQLEYPTAAINVLVIDNGAEVRVTRLTPQPPRQTDMGTYLHWAGENLAAGASFTISFSGARAVPAPPGLPQEKLRWGAAAVAALGVVGAVVWGYIGKWINIEKTI